VINSLLGQEKLEINVTIVQRSTLDSKPVTVTKWSLWPLTRSVTPYGAICVKSGENVMGVCYIPITQIGMMVMAEKAQGLGQIQSLNVSIQLLRWHTELGAWIASIQNFL